MTIYERLSAALTGRYRLERELGAGGMATVFLAHDEKHDRKVAIKVLKPELAAVLGAERFVVEIKTTASLQHPHILPLFDSGTADGFLFYVMPYLQGETIREKLNRETQFSIEEAVRTTSEIADALDYAHRHGVIHRDIKPENILLHDGRAMVMDFGIALAVSAAAGGRMTETGLSLGTPHYMSPEQATAEKDLTPRADVYSLATVLYEMLTGNPPHVGATAQQIIMKIITEPVQPVTAHRKTVPPNVASALARALEKLPADRFDSAKAFREALGSSGFSYATASAGVTSAIASGASASGWAGRRMVVAAWLVAAVSLAMGAVAWLRKPPEPPFRRFDLSLGTLVPAPNSEVVVSPDGTIIAMAASEGGAERAIYLRHLDGDATFTKLSGSESGTSPSFSPDGQWIVYRRNSNRTLAKLSVNGGNPITLLTDSRIDPYWPHWGAPDLIVFSTPSGSYSMASTGGTPKPMRWVTSRRLFLLPDGSGVLHSSGSDVSLYLFQGDSSITLVPNADGPSYVATGHLLYNTRDGGTFAVAFDPKSHKISGTPIRVLERVAGSNMVRGYAVSSNGTVVQHEGDGSGSLQSNLLVMVDLEKKSIDTVRMSTGRHAKPRFSPDGKMLAMEIFADGRGGMTDIYTLDLRTSTLTQLTFDEDNDEPAWSPDGKRLLYDKATRTSQGEDLYIKPADNSGPERRLTTLGGGEVQAQQWLDDKTLVFDVMTSDRGGEIFTVGADSGSVPVPYMKSPFNEREPRISPDRKLIAYLSDETGAYQVWLRDYPTPQGKWNVSRGEARSPRWSPDGKYLYFFRSGTPLDTLFRVRIDRAPGVVVQAPEVVTTLKLDGHWNWDLHPDGRHFVAVVQATASASNQAAGQVSRWLILENWFTELRRLMAPKGK